MAEQTEVVIVGAGQCGVSLSYYLKAAGTSHKVIERDKAFSVWGRMWDSFTMNTPHWMNALPGASTDFAPGANRWAFGTIADAKSYFSEYLKTVQPPLVEHTDVTEIAQGASGRWRVSTSNGEYDCNSVAICISPNPIPFTPKAAEELPVDVSQFHTLDYRNPEQIEHRNALVVGSGSSGVQICEDLAKSGRFENVYLSRGGTWTLPRKILGIPTYVYMRRVGALSIKRRSWLGRLLHNVWIRTPEGDLAGGIATPPSPRLLKRRYGVKLVGKVVAADDRAIKCDNGEKVPLDDLQVIWCTGFRANYDFIRVEQRELAFDDLGQPVHERGVVLEAPGLYFMGLRFQSHVASRFMWGVGPDARYIARRIVQRANGQT